MNLIDILTDKKIVVKKTQALCSKKLKTKKRGAFYKITDAQNNFVFIIFLNKKTTLTLKDAQEIEKIFKNAIHLCSHHFKKKVIFVQSSLSKKAQMALKENKWRILK